jgi:N-acetyltransferase 10
MFSAYDLKRLEGYANQLLDYHVIMDLIPQLASLWFDGRVNSEGIKLTNIQAALLLAIGLQRKTVDDVEVWLRLAFSLPL